MYYYHGLLNLCYVKNLLNLIIVSHSSLECQTKGMVMGDEMLKNHVLNRSSCLFNLRQPTHFASLHLLYKTLIDHEILIN